MEVWKSSPLAPAHVEVSNLGRVRTLDRLASSVRAGQPTQLRAGKLLSPWANRLGYLFVSVKEGDRRPKYAVHRLIASAFCEGFDPTLSVNHIDGDKANNLPENLEWVTLQKNTALAWATGQCTPEAHAMKLTTAQVREIKRNSGTAVRVLAATYGVSESMIYSIRQGRRWASVA